MIETEIAPPAAPTAPILLGAYAARSCPVKTQNAFDPTLEQPEDIPQQSPGVSELFEGPQAHRTRVIEQLITSAPGRVVDLRLLVAEPRAAQTDACIRAMDSGAAVIIGGCLPVDLAGHRAGYPDLLIRGADGPDGGPRYHPGEVKGHLILDVPRPRPSDESSDRGSETPPSSVRCSTLAAPSPADATPLVGRRLRTGSRSADLVQLAHYQRLLEACGYAGSPLGAIIGTDLVSGEPVLSWVELSEPMLRTFSRTSEQGWRLRSPLERYDYEHAFRIDIARVAQAQTGDPDRDPPLLVRPIVSAECGRCVWWRHCRPQLHPDDVSLRIDKTPLDLREISALRRRGIGTITDLVDADLDELLEWYLPEVTHRSGAESRIRTAARRARMILDGDAFVRETSGPIEVPSATVEIDLDIESSYEGRVYLWGFLIQRAGSEPVYREFSRFDDLDDDDEAELAVRAFTWLQTLIDSASTVAVYHYSGYETTKITELAERTDDPTLRWAADDAGEHFVDLLEIVKSHYFGASGLGLKVIAKQAGFRWRDDDPGGLNSQVWFRDAVRSPDPHQRELARVRVLEYNEDDVRATHRLRAWLRAQ